MNQQRHTAVSRQFFALPRKIKLLKYKSINNVKEGDNTLQEWKISDIWWLSLRWEYSV